MTGLEWIILGATILGTLTSAWGTYESGRSQAKMAEYNAAVTARNAEQERLQAEYEEKRHREQMEKRKATQRSLYYKAGVTTEGSPLLVMEETAAKAEQDALAIRYGGEVSASRWETQAAIDRMRGREYKRAGALGAGTSLLTGASAIGQQYMKFKG